MCRALARLALVGAPAPGRMVAVNKQEALERMLEECRKWEGARPEKAVPKGEAWGALVELVAASDAAAYPDLPPEVLGLIGGAALYLLVDERDTVVETALGEWLARPENREVVEVMKKIGSAPLRRAVTPDHDLTTKEPLLPRPTAPAPSNGVIGKRLDPKDWYA